jgi:arabinan endo-1,5-alpha-L-arabinosidase
MYRSMSLDSMSLLVVTIVITISTTVGSGRADTTAQEPQSSDTPAILSQSEQRKTSDRVKRPRRVGDYVTVYRPAGDRFPGPDTTELKAGQWYDDWVPNDHTILFGPDNRWHAFGITHPLTSTDDVHQGEFQSFHAIAPPGTLADVLKDDSWHDLPKILPPAERPEEILPNHAPYIVRRDDAYWMMYGPSPMRLAVSKDLRHWVPKGPLFHDSLGARDPNLLSWENRYIVTYCAMDQIRARTSPDLLKWSAPRTILTMPKGVAPESPSLIRYDETFYLFVCGWDGIWDKKTVQGAYQHRTYVFQSDDPFRFDGTDVLTTLESHAPEIFQDTQGNWYISSVEWPERGMSIARLAWE